MEKEKFLSKIPHNVNIENFIKPNENFFQKKSKPKKPVVSDAASFPWDWAQR
jgi:hypothetical protein